ncbi:unnamed protein product [Ascophyllum nodosum]
MVLSGTVFKKNRGATEGGGIASFFSGSIVEEKIYDTPFYVATSSSQLDEETVASGPSKITGCHFDGNTATEGGAIYTAVGYDMVVDSSFTKNYAAVQGGALLHSGVLVALTNCTFDSNMAGEDGLAVMSFGLINNITDVTFENNSFFCASGEYSLEEDSDEVENPDNNCRWGVVCSRCTDSKCDAPTGIDMDSFTVPVCEVVPEGVNTTGNSGMTLETLSLMPGFYRTFSKSREILECYREEACMGGSNADRYCAEGYAGPYCAACDEGYGSGFQYSCHSCQGSDKWAAIGGAIAVLIIGIFVVALGVTYLVGVVDRPISERRGGWERRVSNFRDGLVRAIPLTAIKITLVSWQIISQFSGVVNVQYPPVYKNFLAALSFVNPDLGSILSLSCVVETNFYVRLLLGTITPAAVLGALAITCRVAILRNGHSIHAKRIATNKHLAVGLFLLFMVYSSVSYTIFQTFVCDPLDSGDTYLRADYEIVCWTRTHVVYLAYAGLMILVYPVGIPAVFALVLYKNRDDIKSIANPTINNRTRVPPESEAIRDLWAPYKRNRYYYEVIECGRRIALTGLAVFIYPGSTAQVAIEALLAVVFSYISEILSPFTEPLDAWLYRSGTLVIFLSMYFALLLKVDAADEESHSQNVFAGLLIATHVGMVLVVIANALLSISKGFREVRAIEMPVVIQDRSKKSGSASTRENNIEILEEDEDDASKYISNPIFAGPRQTNFLPL